MNDHALPTLAVNFSSPDMLTALLMGGASPDVYSNMGYSSRRTAEEGGPIKMYTPLHYCVMQNKLDHATVLLDHGADISLPDCHGKTALSMATSDEMRALIQMYELPMAVPCAEEADVLSTPSNIIGST